MPTLFDIGKEERARLWANNLPGDRTIYVRRPKATGEERRLDVGFDWPQWIEDLSKTDPRLIDEAKCFYVERMIFVKGLGECEDYHIRNWLEALGKSWQSLRRLGIQYPSCCLLLRSAASTDRHLKALSNLPRACQVAPHGNAEARVSNAGAEIFLALLQPRGSSTRNNELPANIAHNIFEGVKWDGEHSLSLALARAGVDRAHYEHVRAGSHMISR